MCLKSQWISERKKKYFDGKKRTIGTFWGQAQFLFFPITALWNSSKWDVIQQMKTVAFFRLTLSTHLRQLRRTDPSSARILIIVNYPKHIKFGSFANMGAFFNEKSNAMFRLTLLSCSMWGVQGIKIGDILSQV